MNKINTLDLVESNMEKRETIMRFRDGYESSGLFNDFHHRNKREFA